MISSYKVTNITWFIKPSEGQVAENDNDANKRWSPLRIPANNFQTYFQTLAEI